jgi:hypothetical protein
MAHLTKTGHGPGRSALKASGRFSSLFSILFIVFFSISSSGLQGADAYCRSPWISLKTVIVPQILGRMEEMYTPKSLLRQYYQKKYSREELESVRNAVATILSSLDAKEREQAVREVLSFHHVVYHRTRWHRMENNVRIIKTYDDLIDGLAKRYEVPPPLARAILCWENSGDISKMSYAQCGGLGQLSLGALERAHRYGSEMAHYRIGIAKVHDFLYKSTGKDMHRLERDRNLREARELNVEGRHRKLAKASAIPDERLIPECNAEDSVIFMKVLLDYYDGQPDLAIASYHNGVTNMDDLLRDYLGRWFPWIARDRKGERNLLLPDLAKFHINYLSLWSDLKSREMLSGYRTMDGEITTDSNRSEALGDESDIYLWKIVGAYGALLCSDQSLMERIDEYSGRWDVVECRGLKLYTNQGEIREAIKKGELVRLPPGFRDLGIGKISLPSPFYEKELQSYNYYVTPELAGFMDHLARELKSAAGNEKIQLPVKAALQSKALFIAPSRAELDNERYRTHLQGVALDVPRGDKDSAALYAVLNRHYLRDRIYLIGEEDHWHICLNPRYGNEFYWYYSAYRNREKKPK